MDYDLEEVKQEFLKYAPHYAQEEARQAIEKVLDLQAQGVIHDGLYYIVLVDLVGSTKFLAEYGNERTVARIQAFVTSSFRALKDLKLSNVALFIKEIGDAVLYVFQHFPDVLKWRTSFADWLKLSAVKEPIHIRTCVHVGEVFLDGVNPLSLAVSQCFKMEKKVQADDVVLTDPAYHVAWPTIARAYHAFADYGEVDLDGFKTPVRLHELVFQDEQDLKELIGERLD